MGLGKFIVDMVGHLAWPTLIAGFLFIFRDPLKSLLNAFSGLALRVTKVGPAEFQGPTINQQPDPETGLSLQKSSSEQKALAASPLPDDPDLEPWVDNVRQIISDNGLEHAADLEARLIRALALSSRHCDFEMIARTIFGTQLAAIKELDKSGPLSATAFQDLHSEHETRVLSESQGKPLSSLVWLGFLRDNKLARLTNDGKYELTNTGRLFLQFAGSIGLTEQRVF
jgi:hypothetical protein